MNVVGVESKAILLVGPPGVLVEEDQLITYSATPGVGDVPEA